MAARVTPWRCRERALPRRWPGGARLYFGQDAAFGGRGGASRGTPSRHARGRQDRLGRNKLKYMFNTRFCSTTGLYARDRALGVAELHPTHAIQTRLETRDCTRVSAGTPTVVLAGPRRTHYIRPSCFLALLTCVGRPPPVAQIDSLGRAIHGPAPGGTGLGCQRIYGRWKQRRRERRGANKRAHGVRNNGSSCHVRRL